MLRSSRVVLVLGALLLPLAGGLGALALGMDSNWDLRNYHWYNGWGVIAGRLGRDLVVAQTPSWYTPYLDVPLFLLGTHVPARAAAFVLGAIGGLNGVLVMLIAYATFRPSNRLTRALAALAIGAAGLGGACAISELGTAFNDYMLMLGVLAALLVLVRGAPGLVSGPSAPASWRAGFAGLLVGLMVGLKLTAAIYALGFGVAMLLVPTSVPRRIALAAALTFGFTMGFAAAGGPWMAYLWQETGNPVFPFFNHVFKSPLMPAVPFRDDHFVPYHDPLAWIFFPFWILGDPYRAMEVPFFDLRLGLALVAMPLGLGALAWRRLRARADRIVATGPVAPVEARLVLVTAFVSYVAWVLLFCIYRYALAIELLAPLTVVLALGLLPGPLWPRMAAAAGLILLAAVTVQPANWGRKPWTHMWVEVQVPPIPDADRAMILMTGFEPTSFVVPSFPTQPRYIRIHSNFTGPTKEGYGINDRMRAAVAAHKGPFYVLFQLARDRRTEESLALYGLSLDRATCVHVPTSIEDDPIVFCPVSRVAAP